MHLYYDRISQMFSLDVRDGDNREIIFLGPFTHSMLKLQEYGLTPGQARAAVLRAYFNGGDAVDLDNVQRMDNA